MPAILMSLAKVPVKLLNTPFQGTLEPSWALDRLFPTADTPGKGYSAA